MLTISLGDGRWLIEGIFSIVNTSTERRSLEVSTVLPIRAGSLVVSGGLLATTLLFRRVIGTALQFSTDLAYGFDLAICAILIFGTHLHYSFRLI